MKLCAPRRLNLDAMPGAWSYSETDGRTWWWGSQIIIFVQYSLSWNVYPRLYTILQLWLLALTDGDARIARFNILSIIERRRRRVDCTETTVGDDWDFPTIEWPSDRQYRGLSAGGCHEVFRYARYCRIRRLHW